MKRERRWPREEGTRWPSSTGPHVDAFDLLHDDFFDHLVLLPDAKQQKGNPRRVTRTGDSLNYQAD